MSEEGNMEKTEKHVVEIRFDAASRQISCMPHKLIVRKNDVIVWRCEGGHPFTLDFGWDSPFPDFCIVVPAMTRQKEVNVPDDAPAGLYEYYVALYDEGTRSVYTFDPEMIIRRGA
jgi:hypothetical protein